MPQLRPQPTRKRTFLLSRAACALVPLQFGDAICSFCMNTLLFSCSLPPCIVCKQVKVSPVKVFVIHVEVMTADQNTHRISISNMYTPDTLKVGQAFAFCGKLPWTRYGADSLQHHTYMHDQRSLAKRSNSQCPIPMGNRAVHDRL